MAEKKERTYGGAAVAGGGAAVAASTPFTASADRALVGARRRKVDRRISDIKTNMPKSAGERRGLPQTSQMKQRQPAASKKQLKLRQSAPPSAKKTAPLREQRKAAYRSIHELTAHKKTIKPVISPRSLRANIAAVGIGAPLSYAGARHQLKENKVSKKQTKEERKLSAGYAGAVGGAAAYQGAGYAAIPVENKAAKKIKANPAQHRQLTAHREKHITPGTHKNDPNYRAFFRKYPKDLPGAKLRRTLSWSHTGKTGTALTLGAAGASAAGAVKLADKKKVKKNLSTSAFGVEH